jgi:hypothetical protein
VIHKSGLFPHNSCRLWCDLAFELVSIARDIYEYLPAGFVRPLALHWVSSQATKLTLELFSALQSFSYPQTCLRTKKHGG